MNLKWIILSKRSQIQKATGGMILFTWHSGKAQLWRQKKQGLTKMGTAEFFKAITACSGHTTAWFVKTQRTVYYKKWILCKLYQQRNDKNKYRKR